MADSRAIGNDSKYQRIQHAKERFDAAMRRRQATPPSPPPPPPAAPPVATAPMPKLAPGRGTPERLGNARLLKDVRNIRTGTASPQGVSIAKRLGVNVESMAPKRASREASRLLRERLTKPVPTQPAAPNQTPAPSRSQVPVATPAPASPASIAPPSRRPAAAPLAPGRDTPERRLAAAKLRAENVADRQFHAEFSAAFRKLDRENRGVNYVALTDLRKALPHYNQEQFNAGLRKLRVADKFTLDTEDGRRLSTNNDMYRHSAAEDAAAIREGGTIYRRVSYRDDDYMKPIPRKGKRSKSR